jgi:hypothetical protein
LFWQCGILELFSQCGILELLHCQNNSKIPHCQNNSKIPQCQNNSKIPHCQNNYKIPHCQNNYKIPHCQNNSTGAWGMDFVSSSTLFEVSDMARNMKMELLTFSLILYQSKNCGHRIHVLFMMYDVYWYCQMKKKRKGNPRVFYTFYLVYIWHCRIKLFLRHLPNCPCSNFSRYVDLFQEISTRIAKQLRF